MPDAKKIKTIMERNIKAVTLKPAIGQSTELMRVDVDEDGRCHVADGEQRMVIDMSESFGGGGTTPSPAFFARAALGCCLAQGYVIWAACLDVPINALSIELHCDSDMRGNLGIDGKIPASYTSVRYVVHIDSPASRAKLEELADKVDALDWVLDVFRREIPLSRELRVTNSQPADRVS